eukprot:6192963-Amphidinium_carterae.2
MEGKHLCFATMTRAWHELVLITATQAFLRSIAAAIVLPPGGLQRQQSEHAMLVWTVHTLAGLLIGKSI